MKGLFSHYFCKMLLVLLIAGLLPVLVLGMMFVSVYESSLYHMTVENAALVSCDLAQELFISDAYLGRLFIRHYHMKFTDYLHQIRIQNAVPLLRDPKWKVYQIAQKMGYNNQQYFCNVFKKMMGVSPHQFRHSLGLKMPDDEEKEETL